MNTNHATRKSTETAQNAAAATGRVFRFPYKRIPVVTKEMWAQIEAAARIPRKGQRYPEIVEAPDGSI